jgi:putative spermidine/putrescine transport system ATP-binding protein
MSALELEHLSKTYPRQPIPALRDVSLEVADGELVALLGPSGSGKSTILKLIAGIEQPDHGTIRLQGRDLAPVAANRRGAVLMFQKAYLFPFLNVADNIAFGLNVRGEARRHIDAEVERMLELIGLPGIRKRFPAQLSGGEQQRVALARALVTRPNILLLDEPLSSLDTAVRLGLQEAIRQIQRELGITTLLVTHDLSEAVAMSDRTALLLDGKIVACTVPHQLFQRPPTRAAAEFMGITTFLRGHFAGGQLATPLGKFAVAGVNGAAREATFAIRPEHTRVVKTATPNTLHGNIQDVLYKGEFSEVRVRVRDATIRARLYDSAAQTARGDAVMLEFPAEHLFEIFEEAP